MELIKVADFYGEDNDTVEITKDWYAGFYGQLREKEEGWEFSWHQVDWYESDENPTTNSHIGASLIITETYLTKQEAIAEGRALLIKFLIEGLVQLHVDEQESLINLKEQY